MIQEPEQLCLFEAELEYDAEPNYPSHRAKTALELMRWIGKSGRIRGRVKPKVKVIDCRHVFGGVHVLVELDRQREWYSTAAIDWPFITNEGHI
jgi:hypothetical protein